VRIDATVGTVAEAVRLLTDAVEAAASGDELLAETMFESVSLLAASTRL